MFGTTIPIAFVQFVNQAVNQAVVQAVVQGEPFSLGLDLTCFLTQIFS